MNGRYLLDTNIVIALFASEAAVQTSLANVDEVFISSIVVGELCYGARKSARTVENLERIDQFVASSVVLGCEIATAHYYGQVKNQLRLKGRPLPENDIWIRLSPFNISCCWWHAMPIFKTLKTYSLLLGSSHRSRFPYSNPKKLKRNNWLWKHPRCPRL